MNVALLEKSDSDMPAPGHRPERHRSIFRIDRFDCPVTHQRAFEDRLAIIHGYFDTLPGCLTIG